MIMFNCGRDAANASKLFMKFQTILDLDLETFTKLARIAALKNITIGEVISQELAIKKIKTASRIEGVDDKLPFVSEKDTFDHKITSKDDYFIRLENAKKQNPVKARFKVVQRRLLDNLIDNQDDIQNQDKILSNFVENALSTAHKPTTDEVAKNLVAKHVYTVYLLTGMINNLNMDVTYFEKSCGRVLTDFEFKRLVKAANDQLLKLSKSELTTKTLENFDINYNPFQLTEVNILRLLLLNESELAKSMLSDVDFNLSEINKILFERLHEN